MRNEQAQALRNERRKLASTREGTEKIASNSVPAERFFVNTSTSDEEITVATSPFLKDIKKRRALRNENRLASIEETKKNPFATKNDSTSFKKKATIAYSPLLKDIRKRRETRMNQSKVASSLVLQEELFDLSMRIRDQPRQSDTTADCSDGNGAVGGKESRSCCSSRSCDDVESIDCGKVVPSHKAFNEVLLRQMMGDKRLESFEDHHLHECCSLRKSTKNQFMHKSLSSSCIKTTKYEVLYCDEVIYAIVTSRITSNNKKNCDDDNNYDRSHCHNPNSTIFYGDDDDGPSYPTGNCSFVSSSTEGRTCLCKLHGAILKVRICQSFRSSPFAAQTT